MILMSLTKRALLVSAALSGFFGSAMARAESTITFQTPVTISSYTDVINPGQNLISANDANSISNPNIVNGVTFTDTPPASDTSAGVNGIASNSGVGGDFGNLSASYKAILTYGATGSSPSFTIGGLTDGQSYMFQFFADYSKVATSDSEQLSTTANGSANTSGAISYNATDKVGGLGQYIIGTFTAIGTSETIYFLPSDSTFGALSSAIVISTVPVPEPSSIVMMGIGGLVGLGAFVRRQRSRRVVAN